MNAEQLAYWLRGAMETRNFDEISTKDAIKLLKDIQAHSALPFKKITPDLSQNEKALKSVNDRVIEDLIKKAKDRPITPNWPGPSPLPYTPAFSPSDYWLKQPNIKPGELYC